MEWEEVRNGMGRSGMERRDRNVSPFTNPVHRTLVLNTCFHANQLFAYYLLDNLEFSNTGSDLSLATQLGWAGSSI